MQNTHYFNVVVTGLTPAQAEIASALFFDNGAEGVSENLPFFQSNESADAVLLDQDEVTLQVYFSNEPPAGLKTEVTEQFPEARLEVFKEPHKDWLAEWKKFYSPFELAHGVWVVPAWLETPAEAKHEIRINPGMAFGTGTHETTRLAAQMMAKNFLTSDTIGADRELSLLDVGTGTGILCFLAEKFGFSTVIGLEIDPEARRSARENIPLNKNSNIQILEEQLHEVVAGAANAPKEYDWVVANIIDGVLTVIQDDLKKAVAPGGYLMLTGILDERDELFLSRFSFDGFTLVKRDVLGEWVGYLLHRKD